MSQLRKATRKKAKIRLGLSAVSGAGKTYSALLIAKGLVGSWDKVAVIDTENGSADLYAHLGDFNVLQLLNTSAEGYISAIKECENAGMECIIVDSITHFWDYCLDLQAKHGGNYQSWAKVTPIYQSFLKAILNSSAHIITTVRRKQDYDMTKDGNGRLKVEKAGLKEEVRGGYEYELTVNLAIDSTHFATAEKDRTGLFMDKPSFIPTEKTGEIILKWCEEGIDIKIPEEELLKKLSDCKTTDDVNALATEYSHLQPFADNIKVKMREKYTELTSKNQ